MAMEIEPIQNMIYEIRGYKVMLDFDLAGIYEVPTKVLNQAVKRNNRRFPSDFMFQLTNKEFTDLRSQIVTSRWGGTRYLPYAFTEHGVTMLSSVLNSEVAIDASILIVRAFVAIRNHILNTPVREVRELQNEVRELKVFIEGVFSDQSIINKDTRIQLEQINRALAELQAGKQAPASPRRRIGYRMDDKEEFM